MLYSNIYNFYVYEYTMLMLHTICCILYLFMLCSIPSLWAKFPHGSTDSTNAAGRMGSNVYEVNLWLWQFGRDKPLSCLSLGGFRWQTLRTIQLSSRQTVIGVLLRRASAAAAALQGRVQSDLASKKAGCAKIYHVYPILI